MTDEMRTLVLFGGVALGAIFLVGFMVATFVTVLRTNSRNRGELQARHAAFLSAGVAVDMVPERWASLSMTAEAAAPHSLWLDVDVRGAITPVFDLEAEIDAGGAALGRTKGRVEFDGQGDPVGLYAGPGFTSLVTTDDAFIGGDRVVAALRVLSFSAPPGAVAIRVRCSPARGTTFARCRAIVTRVAEPPSS